MAWWMLALQAVSGPVLPAAAPIGPRPLAATCTLSSDPNDITVCARNDEPYRLRKLPPRQEAHALPKAETSLLGGRAAAETEQGSVGGFPSNRIMARMKWAF